MPYTKYLGSELDTKTLVGRLANYSELLKSPEKYGDIEKTRVLQRLGSFVTAKGNRPGEVWYAEIVCFVRITPPSHTGLEETDATFVRWYTNVKKTKMHGTLGLPWLKLETTSRENKEGKLAKEPFTDLSFTSEILEPVFLQKDPSSGYKWYFHNIYVR